MRVVGTLFDFALSDYIPVPFTEGANLKNGRNKPLRTF